MTSLNILPFHLVKLPKGILMIAIVLLISMSMVVPAIAQAPDDINKSTAITESNDNTKENLPQKNNTMSPLLKGLIIALIGIVALVAFWLMAPFFPVFQSKGDPGEIIEKIGCEDGDQKGKRVLVGYCTRHGSTVSIAEKIGEVLCDKGFQVDVRSVMRLGDDDLSEYDAFVLGSGIIWSKLMPSFMEFIDKFRHIWPDKSIALFMVCLTIQRDTEANRNRVKNYFDNSIKHVPEFKPFDRCAFAGRVTMEKLTFWESSVLKLFFLLTPQKGGDHRDMNKVAAWADKISTSL
jgi:menaquinone-dependent protoporphyrinogen IX oxidase